MSSQFLRNSGTLLSGNIVAQGIAFAAYMVLLRLFTPEDFGLCNVFLSYIEVLIILSTCKYELSIVIAENNKEAADMAKLTLRMNALVSILFLVLSTAGFILMVTGVWTDNPLQQNGESNWWTAALLLLIPVMVYLSGTIRVYTAVCNRYNRYKTIATGEIASSTGSVVFRFLFGVLAPLWQPLHSLGLPLGTALGKMAGHIYYRHIGKQLITESTITDRKLTSMGNRALLHKHRNFPLYVMPKEFVSSFSANLPFMWLALYFDKPLIGLMALAMTFTTKPVNIIANAFEKVLYASSAEKVNHKKPIAAEITRFALILLAVSMAVAVIMFFFAEPLFTWIFGQQWIGTGYYVRCLLPWVAVLVVANSLTFVGNIFGTQRVDFLFQILQLILRIAALFIGIKQNDFKLAILLFAAASTLVQMMQAVWYIYQVYRYDRQLPHPID